MLASGGKIAIIRALPRFEMAFGVFDREVALVARVLQNVREGLVSQRSSASSMQGQFRGLRRLSAFRLIGLCCMQFGAHGKVALAGE